MANERVTRLYLKALIVVALVVLSGLTVWTGKIELGLDLRGGSEMRYRIKHEDLSEQDKVDITKRTIDVIKRRIDPRGNREIDIRQQGKYRFNIQLPGTGAKESTRIEELIRRSGKLRFCLVNANMADRERARKGERVPGFTPFIVGKRDASGLPERWRVAHVGQLAKLSDQEANGWLLVQNKPSVTGEDLGDISAATDKFGLPAVGFAFKGRGRKRFESLTEKNKALSWPSYSTKTSIPRHASRRAFPGEASSAENSPPRRSRTCSPSFAPGACPPISNSNGTTPSAPSSAKTASATASARACWRSSWWWGSWRCTTCSPASSPTSRSCSTCCSCWR